MAHSWRARLDGDAVGRSPPTQRHTACQMASGRVASSRIRDGANGAWRRSKVSSSSVRGNQALSHVPRIASTPVKHKMRSNTHAAPSNARDTMNRKGSRLHLNGTPHHSHLLNYGSLHRRPRSGGIRVYTRAARLRSARAVRREWTRLSTAGSLGRTSKTGKVHEPLPSVTAPSLGPFKMTSLHSV